MADPTVYILHAVDVEGPMIENLEATFERMQSYGLPKSVAITEENLEKIQKGAWPGLEPALSETLQVVFSKKHLAYLESWEEIDAKIQHAISPAFRKAHASKDGNPYLYSWFIYDHHEGFSNNPRFHEVGTHKIFDHYLEGLLKNNPFNDGIYWHYHHPSMCGDALESNTSWTNRPVHEEIIARRIIERNWYFSAFRAGIHIERNDMSHWLEMFVPFDYSAWSKRDTSMYYPGCEWDWRHAPLKWGAWHPDWYDYRREGQMKRWLFRSTSLSTYYSSLNEEEVDEAFQDALKNGTSVLNYYNHDYRDMAPEIEAGYAVIRKIAEKYPGVDWKFVNALDAAHSHLGIENRPGPRFEVQVKGNQLLVHSDQEIFGPQPFLAIEEEGRFFRDNFTDEGNRTWGYVFRRPDHVIRFGIAANNPSGNYGIFRGDLKGNRK